MNIARSSWAVVMSVAIAGVLQTACESVPLLAPTGSSITLTALATTLPVNGSTQLIAQVIEASGTPPHSGTHVIFTTSLGSVVPPESETDINGRAVAVFQAGTANGTATITVTSGGAGGTTQTSGGGGGGNTTTTTTTTASNVVKIAVGTAAVGRVSLTANPNIIASLGGSSTIVANVVDLNGSPLPNAPVTFGTSAGALSASVVNTDTSGAAQTVLTTSITATVTATVGVGTATGGGNAGGGNGGGTGNGGTTPGGSTSSQSSATVTVTVSPVPVVSIAATTTNGATFTAGSPITFTISAQPATNSTAQIRDVSVDFGDGSPPVDLGAVSGQTIPIQYSFKSAGTYTVRVTVVDTLGATVSAATRVVVLAEPPLSVTISATPVTSGTTTTVTFTATVTPNTATVASYLWNFGDGQVQTTTGNQVVHPYQTGSGVKTVTLTVTTTTGQQTTSQIAVNP